MLIKLAGAGLIFFAGIFWGLLKSGELVKRERSLRDIKTALNILESEIVFSSHYLKYAFLRISKICGCAGLFSDMSSEIGEFSAAEAWRHALLKNKKELFLKDIDVEILNILGAELGLSDRERQVNNIRHVSLLLEQNLEEAHEEYLKTAKLYRSMGILGGLFLIIILL